MKVLVIRDFISVMFCSQTHSSVFHKTNILKKAPYWGAKNIILNKS